MNNVCYDELLAAVANTRLMFNSLAELEDFFDNHSIRSNGINRAFDSEQRRRGAFRDLMLEADNMTNGSIRLDTLLDEYRAASEFYKANLARRKNKKAIADQYLGYIYGVQDDAQIKVDLREIFRSALDEEVDESILVLLLLDVLPGYSSRCGDVEDGLRRWNRAIDFMAEFTRSRQDVFSCLPVIGRARGESNKTRLMLIYYMRWILGTFQNFLDDESKAEITETVNSQLYRVELDGYWNERSDDEPESCFWSFEQTAESGKYFATRWYKDSENVLTAVTYNVVITSEDGKIYFEMMHPSATAHLVEGAGLEDADMGWYSAEMPGSLEPASILLRRRMPSQTWKERMTFVKVQSGKVSAIYDKWRRVCRVERPYADMEYHFELGLWAITQESVYVYDDKKNCYYIVPRDHERVYCTDINDAVGILEMNGRRYIAFDNTFLYIPITPESLSANRIEIQDCPSIP